MFLVFALVGTFTAAIAGVTALITGHSWWMGLASYAAVGLLTVSILAVFMAVAVRIGTRKGDAPSLRAHMPVAEH